MTFQSLGMDSKRFVMFYVSVTSDLKIEAFRIAFEKKSTEGISFLLFFIV